MTLRVKAPVTARHKMMQNGVVVYVVDHVKHAVRVDSTIHASLFSA